MVALDNDDGDARIAQALEGARRLEQGAWLDGALVEQIPCQQGKVDLPRERIIDHGFKGAGKVIVSLSAIVLLVTQMDVGCMEKANHDNKPSFHA